MGPRLSFLAPLLVLLAISGGKCMTLNEILDFSSYLEKTSLIEKPKIDGVAVEAPAPAHEEVSDAGGDEEDHPSPDAWEQSGKFEGDLVLNARQRRLIVEDVAEGLSRNGLKDITKRWPNNELIYYIQKEHFSSGQVQAIQDGLEDIARSSCVTFRPYKKGDQDAVVIVGNRRGCFSAVGYQGGYQVLNLSARHPLGRGCFRHGTVVHELLHSLGFYHMQSSPDRDDYIDVKWDNIIEGAKHNFRKYNSFSVSDFGVPYDYDSVLHYSKRAFSNNGKPTLVPKKGGAQIGQRRGMSDGDSQKLNKMYCDKDSDSSADAVNDGPKKASLKKKPSNNKPFEGHGLGYYQGKSVIVKLPKLETLEINEENVEHEQVYENMPETLSEAPPVNSEAKDEEPNESDEVFIDISKLLAETGYPDKPYFDFGGLIEQSRESGHNIREFNDKDDETRYNGFSDHSSPAILEDNFKNNHEKTHSYGGSEKFQGNSQFTFKPEPKTSTGQQSQNAGDYPDYNKWHEDSFDKSSPFTSAEVTSNPVQAKYNADHKDATTTRNTYGDYVGYIEPDKSTHSKHLNADNPELNNTKENKRDQYDIIFSIPSSVRDWWGGYKLANQ